VVDYHYSQITTEMQKVAKLAFTLKDGAGRLANDTVKGGP
jgi:hypothetical protein